MAEVKVSALTALTTVDDLDLLVLADVSTGASKKSTKAQFLGSVLSNTTGTYTSANATTLGNQSGTNTGDQTSIVGLSGTVAQFNTAITDATLSGNNTGDQTLRTDAEVEDLAGGIFTGNTETGITSTYQVADNTLDLVVNNATALGNLSGTNTGDQTSIVGISGTVAQFNTAITDATLSGSNTGDEDLTSINALGVTSLGTVSTGVWNGTVITVPNGGTGASTFTNGGILLGSTEGAITATAALADGEMLVGDGTDDPSIESGATLRDSIGVAIGSDVQAYDADNALLDVDQTWTGAQRATVTALTSATTISINFNDSNDFSLTMAHDATLDTPTGTEVAGQHGSIFITQDATTPRTLSFNAAYLWVGGTDATITATTSAKDTIDYRIRADGVVELSASLALA